MTNLAAMALEQLPDLEAAESWLQGEGGTLAARPGSGAAARRGVAPEGGAAAADAADSEADADPEAPQRVLAAGARGLNRLRREGREAAFSPTEAIGLRAVIHLVGRPALHVEGGRFQAPPPGWEVLEEHRAAIEATLPAVGRIELEGVPGVDSVGTGFVVAPGVVMTNRHVVETFAEPRFGGRRWVFRVGRRPFIDFLEERGSEAEAELKIKKVLGVHPTLDLALLQLKGRSGAAPEPLPVAAERPDLADTTVYAVGYPATDNEGVTPPDALLRIFGGVFGTKRLQPGKVVRLMEEAGVFAHDCSTLGGNSGSCVVHLASRRVMGLHFGGAFGRENRAVALWRLRDDPLLARFRVRFEDV